MSSESHHMCVNGRASRAEHSDESESYMLQDLVYNLVL